MSERTQQDGKLDKQIAGDRNEEERKPKPKPKSKNKRPTNGKLQNSAKKPKDSKTDEVKPKKPQPKPLYRELQNLLGYVNPITANGISIKSLSTDPLSFFEKIINDKDNRDELFMTFLLKPSDPDFPYDLGLLTLTLCIPQSYPQNHGTPSIMVLDDNIPRGYSLNIEIGFKQIVNTILENRSLKKKAKKHNTKKKVSEKKVEENKKSEDNNEQEDQGELKIEVVGGNDLLGMIKTLDKYLEKFLSMEKKDTIKLVKVMNMKQESVKEQQLKEQAKEKQKNQKKVAKPEEKTLLDHAKYQKRTEEVDRFKQRFKDYGLKVCRTTPRGVTFKLFLLFKDDHLTLEFNELDQITIEKLHIKLDIPKEYLNAPKKGIKLSVDMSDSNNIEMINSISDTNVRLIFGKLINNINKNFDTFSSDVATINLSNLESDSEKYWSIPSQLNFFQYNIQKFMNEKAEFLSWYSANKEMSYNLT